MQSLAPNTEVKIGVEWWDGSAHTTSLMGPKGKWHTQAYSNPVYPLGHHRLI